MSIGMAADYFKINDHKPLQDRSIISCSPHILKLFLRLRKYDFKLQYSSSKDMLFSGTFSRFHLNHSELELTENSLMHHVHFVLSNLPIRETHLK